MSTIDFSRTTQGNKLGEGTFGTVFRRKDPNGGQYAEKVFNDTEDAWMEKELLEKAKHDNGSCIDNLICLDTRVTNVPENVIMTRLVKGRDVTKLTKQEAFDLRFHGEDFTRQLFLVVATLHEKGIAHLDIKPSNIMYNFEDHQMTLMDLGLGCCTSCSHATCLPHNDPGTEGFKSPELIRHEVVDINGFQLADAYAVGVTLYQLFTYDQQWNRDPMWTSKHPAGLLDTLVTKLTESDPKERWTVLKAFGQFLQKTPTAPGQVRPTHIRPPQRK